LVTGADAGARQAFSVRLTACTLSTRETTAVVRLLGVIAHVGRSGSEFLCWPTAWRPLWCTREICSRADH